MQRYDTITCAITPGAGRVLPTTASVFRAVGKGDFVAESSQSCAESRHGGCDESSNSGFAHHNPPACAANASACSQGRTPAMVYETGHSLHQLHEPEEAIRKGTLFPRLYMPMKGECADACGAQLCEGQAEAFAAWELRLYLNTHPRDREALRLFRQLARKACQPNYATTFAEDCDDGWNWTDAPWPWEFNCGCE